MRKSRAASALIRCAERAEELLSRSPAAEEAIRFAADLYRAQAIVAGSDLSGELEADAGALLSIAGELQLLLLKLPGSPRPSASDLISYHRERRRTESTHDFAIRAILRPYFQRLAEAWIPPRDPSLRCSFCGGPPWIASRRSAGSDGATRTLSCAWCATEWTVNRILCPSCGETDPEKLRSFSSETSPAVRIEACEVCSGYLKSIDLTVDARPIPEIDDLLTVSMDLWAREQGFTRIEPGLAGC